jgi:hypothetical protein
MNDEMTIRWEETSAGKVTRAAYIGPCGSRMASSFSGWVDRDWIRRRLEWMRQAVGK